MLVKVTPMTLAAAKDIRLENGNILINGLPYTFDLTGSEISEVVSVMFEDGKNVLLVGEMLGETMAQIWAHLQPPKDGHMAQFKMDQITKESLRGRLLFLKSYCQGTLGPTLENFNKPWWKKIFNSK